MEGRQAEEQPQAPLSVHLILLRLAGGVCVLERRPTGTQAPIPCTAGEHGAAEGARACRVRALVRVSEPARCVLGAGGSVCGRLPLQQEVALWAPPPTQPCVPHGLLLLPGRQGTLCHSDSATRSVAVALEACFLAFGALVVAVAPLCAPGVEPARRQQGHWCPCPQRSLPAHGLPALRCCSLKLVCVPPRPLFVFNWCVAELL